MKSGQEAPYSQDLIQRLSLRQIKALREQSKRRSLTRPLALVPQARGREAPLSFAQERLWFLDQLGVMNVAYHSQMAFTLTGRLEVTALERSIEEVIRRHESLRTHFESVAGSPLQVIDPAFRFGLDVRDLSELRGSNRPAEVQRASRAEIERPFVLAKGPLIRACLLKLDDHEHVLILTTHHIVSDGWSWGVLQSELAALYAARVRGESAPLPDLPVQYADYAIWQRQRLQGDALERQLEYWKATLASAPQELQLPTDRSRPAIATYKGARASFHLGPAARGALEQLGRQEGATLFMTMLAAYQLLLSRYSGEQDMLVGCPIAGRTHSQTEGLIGFFVNTIVLRADLSGNPTFRELLRRVRDQTLGAYAHQDLPFEKVVMELRPERNLSRQPIFQVALAMQNPPSEQEGAGLRWTWIETEHATALFDLTLHVFEDANGLHGSLVYATDLFEPHTIAQMVANFRKLLEGIAAEPESPIETLPMVSDGELHRILHEFNDTAAAYPEDRSIQDLFEAQVRNAPHAIAATFEGHVLTYAALNAQANRLAHYLLEQGAEPGERIPILMPRCMSMLIAQLAVLKSGGVYVPVDPGLPEQRIAFVLNDCEARRVIVEQHECPVSGIGPIQWISHARIASGGGKFSSADPKLQLQKRAAAYVMYTSGSTGIPKGVVVPHHAVNRLVINTNYVSILPTDRIAHISNPAFDASTFEIWAALLNGASVVIVPHATVLDPHRFAQVLREERVTALWLTVGLFAQYIDVLATTFPQLRYLLTGGDVVDPELLHRVLRQGAPEHLICAYGPTECTTFSTTCEVSKIDEQTRSISIGRPIANAQVYILDPHLQPVPIGAVGEIHIGGAGVALKYLNRPELTTERFIPDPFRGAPRGRLYKSGDLGRWRSDGTIEFLGRNDQQVKLRGFRVELGEIEAQLIRDPQVKEASVTLRGDGADRTRLVGYLVAWDATPLDVSTVRANLEAALPEYMIPRAFVVLERLPLNQNGKIDRRALPEPDGAAYLSEHYEPPEGEIERTLAAIWRDLLGVERIGRHDNFFALGGHSLLVLKALFRINESLSCTLSAADVYRSPTLAGLAALARGHALEDPFVDLTQEATLAADISAATDKWRVPPEAILLTGATGFVGRFLLAELLQRTDSAVYCLVRAPSQLQALARLKSVMVGWDLWRDEYAHRITAIPGDLRLPRLGLDLTTYSFLAERVDSVYHCGTSMNHLETYEMAKPANVESARELLKFATSGRAKLLNYISTLGVFAAGSGDARNVDENTSIDAEKHRSSSGYVASKWVGEKIFMMGRERGIPCNIFRLGLIWADTQRGRYDELQREYRALESCLMSGVGISNFRFPMPPTPVDYVARAVVYLANQHSSGTGTYHISSADQMEEGLFECCNRVANTGLELLPLYDWIGEMKGLHRTGESLPVVPLIEYAFSMNETNFLEHHRHMNLAAVRFNCAHTHRELEHVGIPAPALNEGLVHLCVQNLRSKNPEQSTSLLRKAHRHSRKTTVCRADHFKGKLS